MKQEPFSLVFGVIVTTVLSGTLVIAGLKAGITPGVSPLVILFAWGAFTRKIAAGGGTRFLNVAQVAGSAGMAVTAGVIFTAPLVQILYTDRGVAALEAEGVEMPLGDDGKPEVGKELLAVLAEHGHAVPEVDTFTIMLLSAFGALVGFGFVGLGTRKFLTDPTLPAPEARACETMIDTAVMDPSKRPRLGRSLFAGLGASFAAQLLVKLGLANEHVVLHSTKQDDRTFTLDLPFTPIYLGIGGLLTIATALLVFGGAMIRLLGDWLLAGVAAGTQAATDFPDNSMRWVGGAAMTVAVGYSLVRFMGARTSGQTVDDPLVEIDAKARFWCKASIAAGLAGIFVWLLVRDGATPFTFAMSLGLFACASVMVVLGAILSLQIGSSASPVSGTIFVTTLVLCLVALAVGRTDDSDVLLLTPLLVGACVAVCAANDSSQDYKTLQLCRLPVQTGFLAQILGLAAGCVAVPIALTIAHHAYVLGSEDLIAPQGKMFATLTEGLLLSESLSELPWYPIAIGAGVGAFAVAMDVLAGRRGLQLPSMALAVGIYLPASLGVGILIGSLFRRVAEGKRAQTNESILAAAGLITGAAFFELLLGIALAAPWWKLDEESLALFGAEGSDVGELARNTLGVLGILTLGAILYVNSRPRREAA